MVVRFEDSFTLVAGMGKNSSVEPTVTVGSGGVVFGCEDRAGVRGDSSVFGRWGRRRRSK